MRFVGKYSFVKRDKKNNIVYKDEQHNVITKEGQNQILKLLSSATPINNFKNMIGYDVLDLSSYKIKPVFAINGTTILKVQDAYMTKLLSYDYDQDDNSSMSESEFYVDDEDLQWKVQSSFFLNKTWNNKINNGKLFRLPKVVEDKANYTRGTFQFDYSTIRDKNIFAFQQVDAILSKDNNTYVTWNGIRDERNTFYLDRNVQNIDFFRVLCRQKVIVYCKCEVPLWTGTIRETIVQQRNKMNVVYKTDLNETSSICMKVKHRKIQTYQTSFSYITEYTVNIDAGTIQLTSKEYSDDYDDHNMFQVIIEYYVHYKDKQLQNGICGMYLDYNCQSKSTTQYSDFNNKRTFFGNGVFSSNGGKTWDDYMCFPWQGTPKKYFDYYGGFEFNGTGQWFNDNYTKPSLMTVQQDQDNVDEHFYSFYPYIYKDPTNFQFLISTGFLNNSQTIHEKIKIKNFLFLIPKYKPQVPKAFVFGSGTDTESIADTKLVNQRLRLDAIICGIQQNQQSNNTIMQWKTQLDFDDANDFEISQVGLNFGNKNAKQIKNNWYCLVPILKQDCDILFSRTKLDNPIKKTDQQTLQVTYEISME